MTHLDSSTTAYRGQFIQGQWRKEQQSLLESLPFNSINPASHQLLWQGFEATPDEVEQAVDAAKNAFNSWQKTTFEARQTLIERFAALLTEHHSLLAQTIHQETGKPLWESKTEAQSMVGKVALSIKAYHQRTPTTDSQVEGASPAALQTRLTHRPHGVFAVFGPYNFPGHLPNGHIVPALLAGNTVVFKPSELTPKVGELMVSLWEQAGLPAGVLNLVQGGRATGESLAASAGIDGLLFTGSSQTGKALHRQLAGRPEILLALEMGGNNPLVVDSVSDEKSALYTIMQSAFISAGQRCTCARRLILVRSAANEALLTQLVKACARIKVGSSDDNFMGSLISNAAADGILKAQAQFIAQGAKALLTTQRLQSDKPFLTPGIIDMTEVTPKTDDEFFGPLLQVIWVDSLEAAIDAANNTRFGLAAGLLSDNKASWQTFYANARAGIVNWNRPLTGASGAAPFGGIGASGNHNPSAFYAADYSAFPVASIYSPSLSLPNELSPGIDLGYDEEITHDL
jgi:succinylglutamic semialdehyde dehydrogenase